MPSKWIDGLPGGTKMESMGEFEASQREGEQTFDDTEPEAEEVLTDAIDAAEALNLALHSTASASTFLVRGNLDLASVAQNQAETWMQLHDRLLAKEGADLLNSAFGMGKMTNRDLVMELHRRAKEQGLLQLQGYTSNMLRYVEPSHLNWAPQ